MQEPLQAQLEKVSLNQTEQFNQAVQAGVAEAIGTASPVSDPATKKYGAAWCTLLSAPSFYGKSP